MLALDHLAIWTAHRDRLVGRLAELTGLPELDGYAPEGRPVARGVRLAGGAFLDIHEVTPAPAAGQVFLGLRGSVGAVERVAAEQGWGVRVGRWQDAPDGSPWSILSFRRDHGILNAIFVIEYGPPEAWTSPVFDHDLYRTGASPAAGPRLARVWMQAADTARSGRMLEALGFEAAGDAASAFAPESGRLYRGTAGDIVLRPGADDRVLRFDLSGDGPAVNEPFGERLTLTRGETP